MLLLMLVFQALHPSWFSVQTARALYQPLCFPKFCVVISRANPASLWTHHADDIEPDGPSCNRPFRDLSNESFKINIVMHACLPHAANKEGIVSFNLATAQSSRGADVSVARHLVAPPKLNASCMRRERRGRSRLELTDIKRSCLSPH